MPLLLVELALAGICIWKYTFAQRSRHSDMRPFLQSANVCLKVAVVFVWTFVHLLYYLTYAITSAFSFIVVLYLLLCSLMWREYIWTYICICCCAFVFVYLLLCICLCILVAGYLLLCICICVFVYLLICICTSVSATHASTAQSSSLSPWPLLPPVSLAARVSEKTMMRLTVTMMMMITMMMLVMMVMTITLLTPLTPC